jgi:hypothetical protein
MTQGETTPIKADGEYKQRRSNYGAGHAFFSLREMAATGALTGLAAHREPAHTAALPQRPDTVSDTSREAATRITDGIRIRRPLGESQALMRVTLRAKSSECQMESS